MLVISMIRNSGKPIDWLWGREPSFDTPLVGNRTSNRGFRIRCTEKAVSLTKEVFQHLVSVRDIFNYVTIFNVVLEFRCFLLWSFWEKLSGK